MSFLSVPNSLPGLELSSSSSSSSSSAFSWAGLSSDSSATDTSPLHSPLSSDLSDSEDITTASKFSTPKARILPSLDTGSSQTTPKLAHALFLNEDGGYDSGREEIIAADRAIRRKKFLSRKRFLHDVVRLEQDGECPMTPLGDILLDDVAWKLRRVSKSNQIIGLGLAEEPCSPRRSNVTVGGSRYSAPPKPILFPVMALDSPSPIISLPSLASPALPQENTSTVHLPEPAQLSPSLSGELSHNGLSCDSMGSRQLRSSLSHKLHAGDVVNANELVDCAEAEHPRTKDNASQGLLAPPSVVSVPVKGDRPSSKKQHAHLGMGLPSRLAPRGPREREDSFTFSLATGSTNSTSMPTRYTTSVTPQTNKPTIHRPRRVCTSIARTNNRFASRPLHPIPESSSPLLALSPRISRNIQDYATNVPSITNNPYSSPRLPYSPQMPTQFTSTLSDSRPTRPDDRSVLRKPPAAVLTETKPRRLTAYPRAMQSPLFTPSPSQPSPPLSPSWASSPATSVDHDGLVIGWRSKEPRNFSKGMRTLF